MSLRSDINKQFIESGEYERIVTALHDKLKSSGWLDEMNATAMVRAQAQEAPNFDQLLSEVTQKGIASVDVQVKKEIIEMIKRYLESIIK